MYNIEKGRAGEKVAREYLIQKSYRIIECNYRNKIGEIDIIALNDGILVFIEVKTRTNINYGYGYESVDYKKQRKILNTSLMYIRSKNINNMQFRYDIIEVYMTNKLEVNHIEDAFCL